jgi:hypothetical protein
MADKPWLKYGGSFVWPADGGRASAPTDKCPKSADGHNPEVIGDCGRGCCDDYRCRDCGQQWRYEWPD